MKLVTQRITKSEVFRDRLLKLLSPRFNAMSVKSDNPNSVDKEDRVTDHQFRSVPHISLIKDSTPDEARIQGSILVELTLETQVHGIDHEETVSNTSTFTCDFTVDISGKPRTVSDLTNADIQA